MSARTILMAIYGAAAMASLVGVISIAIDAPRIFPGMVIAAVPAFLVTLYAVED